MEIKSEIKTFPTYLSDSFKKIIYMPTPARTDGIIYKRYPTHGKFTDDEMDYLITNQIPF
jgi:phenolic acid decarboxylase